MSVPDSRRAWVGGVIDLFRVSSMPSLWFTLLGRVDRGYDSKEQTCVAVKLSSIFAVLRREVFALFGCEFAIDLRSFALSHQQAQR